MKRFKDTGQKIEHFTYLFLVRCPRCDECAEVILKDGYAPVPVSGDNAQAKGWPYLFSPRRLVCQKCGYIKDWQGKQIGSQEIADWYFQCPLWLQISCCSNALWAYNEEHLDFLEELIAAQLRQTYPLGTLANKLPRWMTNGKNREDVLKCIRKLKALLPQEEG